MLSNVQKIMKAGVLMPCYDHAGRISELKLEWKVSGTALTKFNPTLSAGSFRRITATSLQSKRFASIIAGIRWVFEFWPPSQATQQLEKHRIPLVSMLSTSQVCFRSFIHIGRAANQKS